MNHIKGLVVFATIVFNGLAQAGAVNINTASAEEIAAALYGIGRHKAQAIVQYRERHGQFESVQQVKNVKGIGQGIIDGNHGDIRVE